MLNTFLFVIFPYIALLLAIIVGVYRYAIDRYSYSSFSSQFLEKQQLFWGSIHFHYGIIFILTAHIVAALFPSFWRKLLGTSFRLYFLEITGFILGLFVIAGLVILMYRRIQNAKVRTVTTPFDWLLLIVLLLQAISGVYIALFYRWGGAWYVNIAVPWLKSLVELNPQLSHIQSLPWMVKFHVANAFIVLIIFPFTRLVHFISLPLGYLWRPPQVVIWNMKKDKK